MRWLPVRKRVNVIVLTLVVAIILIPFTFKALSSTPGDAYGKVEGDFQMGFYDLMSQRKEIYDAHISTVKQALMVTITDPDDNRFVLKGKFTPTQTKKGKIYFNLTPIFYKRVQTGLMIDGLVDQLMNSNYWLEPLSSAGQPLIVGQSGSIFLYPLGK